MWEEDKKKSTSATHTSGQARTTLCIEVEKESTGNSVLRKAVEHHPLSIIEDKIGVGRRPTKTSTSIVGGKICVALKRSNAS